MYKNTLMVLEMLRGIERMADNDLFKDYSGEFYVYLTELIRIEEENLKQEMLELREK